MAQSAVRRLPRLALWLLCLAYALPGFIGRDPWRNADMQGFGYMQAIAVGDSGWWAPRLLGLAPEFDALLPYWLGAWAIQLGEGWLEPHVAVRLPFMALLLLTLAAGWHAVYQLARSPGAQPVAFAFGGEADPKDYARALADAGLLALIASLGLAQFSHETTPSLAQLAFTALAFHGMAEGSHRHLRAGLTLVIGLAGLALSGAPTMAVLLAAGGMLAWLLEPRSTQEPAWDDGSGLMRPDGPGPVGGRTRALVIALAGLAVGALATALDLWQWRLAATPLDPGSAIRLVVWFTWPAWPLALWTLWRWRHQLGRRHVFLPLWVAGLASASALSTPNPDRSLLLALPALAALAAFALPTLRRSVSALIDWFTLLFFSGGALVIWVVWISLQTGVPAQPAINVSRLAPGFEHSFSLLPFAIALAGTLAWAWLVHWRAGRHRSALWKSLVLPAGGAALCWLLLMTLWLPALDYARSYAPMVREVRRAIDGPGCVEVATLNRGHLAALRYHADFDLEPARSARDCPWRVTAGGRAPDPQAWRRVAEVRRPADARDRLVVYRAILPPAGAAAATEAAAPAPSVAPAARP